METIVLLSSAHEKDRAFKISHAQRLLNYEARTKTTNGWQLTDPKFTLNSNGIISSRNNRFNQKSKGGGKSGKSSQA
jgi:hypothetical protein